LTTAGTARAAAATDMEVFAQRIFERTNELRVACGVPPLLWSEPLGRCAREQSSRKARLRFPGHDDPERGTVAQRLRLAGIAWERCGENLFSERGFDDPVHFAVVFWWYSPGHQANMLNPEFQETGVGVTRDSDETYFVTQIFEMPLPAKARR
ncbi:MAG: CAP domain-containing protein, partial [Acidobacteriota bacterium]